MRTLFLLRHAKSSWKHSGLSDHDRPLNKRGKRDAPRVGRLLRQKRLSPGLIISSSAKRARRTADEVAKWSAFEGTVQLERRLYLADPETVVDVVRRAGAEARRVLVVGHNPGMGELASRLTGQVETDPLPTAGLVQIRLEIDHWKEFRLSSLGRLVNVWRPKELEDD
jgi:phosphohistidine phosphatase